jgi:ribosomal protein L40E
MRCFTHPQADAVAQCSQCQKGICTICAHNVDRATLCSSCYETGLREEIAHAQRSTVTVWVFTGIVTAIAAIAAFGSISQSGAGAILFIPLAFAASWCLFWGWSPVWNGFRTTFAGWGCFGTWFFLLIITVLIAEILVGISMLVGAFTGIKKYNEARRIVANGNQMIAELYGMPIQQMPGTQGGGTV